MAILDSSDWYQDEIEQENGGLSSNGATHIGMFLAWIIERKLYSEALESYAKKYLEDYQDSLITGREILESVLDGKLDDSILSKQIREFSKEYYSGQGYIKDYANLFGDSYDSIYAVTNNQKNTKIVMDLLDMRLTEWKQRNC